MSAFRLSWILGLGATLLCTTAQADLLDPSTLHFGPGAGTACATGGCPLFGGEVNAFGATQLDIFQQSNGGGTLLSNPVLLILAVPNAPANLNMSGAVTGATLYASYPSDFPANGTAVTTQVGTTAYNINLPGPNGFAGTLTSGNVYDVVGGDASSPGVNSSNSFNNFHNWDQAVLGIDATSFGVYVFELDTGSFGANSLLDIGLNNIPLGTFAVAFGENTDGSKVFDNPFTEAGLETVPPHNRVVVPEPSTFALLGGLLLALFGARGLRRV